MTPARTPHSQTAVDNRDQDQDATYSNAAACLTQDQLTALENDGFLLVKNVLPRSLVDSMNRELHRLERAELHATGCNELSPWTRRHLGKPGTVARINAWLARQFHQRMSNFANRALFRLMPSLKDRLQVQAGRPCFKGLCGPLRAEVWFALHTAAMKEAGALRIANLLNKSAAFDVCLSTPVVVSGVSAVLGRGFKLSSLNYRCALPGGGLQPLHVDWQGDVEPGEYRACNTLWFLDDITADNGPTRLLPGSHKRGLAPRGTRSELLKEFPFEVTIEGKAGSVLILNSHTWHGGTTNRTKLGRGLIQCYFVTLSGAPQLDQLAWLTHAAKARLPEQGLELLAGTFKADARPTIRPVTVDYL